MAESTPLPQPSSRQGGTTEPRQAAPGYQPSPDDLEIIRRVEERINFSTREGSRWALEKQIFETIAFFCLEASTPVLMADFTETPIGSLVVGDTLLAPDEKSGDHRRHESYRKWRIATVEAVRKSRRSCLRLEFESGRQLVLTPDHRLLVQIPNSTKQWRQAGELRVGSQVVVGLRTGPVLDAESRGWLGGFLDGEGTLRGYQLRQTRRNMGIGGLSFAQNAGPIMEHARGLVTRLGLATGLTRTGVGCTTAHVRGGAQNAMRVLREVPSLRLRAAMRRMIAAGAISAVPLRAEYIVNIVEVGEHEVVDIQTSTGTFIANGYVSHNCGIQWLEYSDTSKRYTRWNAPSWFPTPVSNYMAPQVGQMQAALLRSEPQGRIRPDTNDPSAREAARVGEALIQHFYDVAHEDALRQKASILAILGGTVIAEDYWNSQAGQTLHIPRQQLQETPATDPAATCAQCGYIGDQTQVGQPCPACGTPLQAGSRPKVLPDGTPAMNQAMVPEMDPTTGQPVVDEMPEGEIESRVRGLFNFYWDQKATDLMEARWCGEAIYADLDWIDQNFPENGKFVAAEEGLDNMNFYEASLLALVGPSIQGTAYYGGTQFYKNGAVLRKYQEKPSRQNPKGLHVIVANRVLLYRGDLPICGQDGAPTGDFSYTEFVYDMVPGRLAGRTPCEDMVLYQKRINAIDAQIILNRKTLLNPWILAPKGSGLDPGRVAMRPGATVLYNSIGVGNSPQVVQGTPLPEQILAEREQAVQGIARSAQDTSMSAQADLPAGTKSGIALNFMREQQQEALMPRLKRWGRWVAARDRKRLLLAQQHYVEPRAVKIMGEGSEWQVKYWRGADLRGNTDVTIDPGTLMPRSASLKTQTVFDAVEARLIDPTNPIDRQKLLEELGLDYETPLGPDQRRARKENAQLSEGQMVQVNDFDDHQVHIPEHMARIKDPSFDYLPQQAQQAFLQHIQVHNQRDEENQQSQIAKQMQLALQQAELQRVAKGIDPESPPPPDVQQGLVGLPPPAGAQPPGGGPPGIDTSGASPNGGPSATPNP